MKNNFLKRLFNLSAIALACAIVSVAASSPSNTPPVPSDTGDDLKIENQEIGVDTDEEPGISPQNDKENHKNDHLD